MEHDPARAVIVTLCRWCGEEHGTLCPWVKAFNLRRDGSVSRVEYVTATDFPGSKTDEKAEGSDDYPRIGPGWKNK